ncbi:MAG: 2Fe-2S iron-sulfur cluster binding domain-containing protein, partial [Ruminococcus sp.]|nr:2Fe-2S iron-sulfur cluster binding domain-containing protein [Candidatus Copronaster equi]
MALKIKVGKIGILDVLKFANQAKTREKIINATPEKEISAVFKINENAKQLHPDYQQCVIYQIIEHKGAQAKTYIFARENGAIPKFRAGQYISVLLNIDGSVVTRPYSISSSPEWTHSNKCAITVRKTPNGFASDWILNNWKVGDKVTISGAEGNFYYDEFRDAKNVIALAGGSGITPFLSMAYAIRDGIEDFNLTIISGSRTKESILFKDELDSIERACDKVKIVHVLSESKAKGFEHGFITAELIEKYAPHGEYSIFMCGPEAMYKFEEGEIAKLGLERKFVRRELLGVTKKIWEHEGYPQECKDKTFKLTVKQGAEEKTIEASANEPLLCAIERNGIAAPSRCRSGECGWCRSKLVSGTVFVPEENDTGRR